MLAPRARGERPPAPARPDAAVGLTVACFALAAGGLGAGAFLAVYDWTTPGAITPLFWSVLAVFWAGVLVQVLAVGARHLRSGPR